MIARRPDRPTPALKAKPCGTGEPARRAPGTTLSLALVAVFGSACIDDAPAPSLDRRDCGVELHYAGAATIVSVVGLTRGTGIDRAPLLENPETGVFSGRFDLPPGLYDYRLSVDGEPVLDPTNPLTMTADDGNESSAVYVADCSIPAFGVDTLAPQPNGAVQATVHFLRARSDAGLDPTSVTASIDGNAGVTVAVSDDRRTAELTASGLAPGKHRLVVSARDVAGIASETLLVSFWTEAVPFDWRDAVIYQVMIDRFSKGGTPLIADLPITSYHGGDLDGVTAAIEAGYFQTLGVNTLWLSPVYENPEGEFEGRDGESSEAYHGYWPESPRQVETRFGGEQALDRLIATAHANGLRVLADTVLNHVHANHPYYRQNPAAGWFNRPAGDCICGVSCAWATDIEDCWFNPFLPDLRWENREVIDRLVGDALFWLTRFDFDGLRIDAVPMMPRYAMRHLRDRVNARLGAGGNDVYLLGENYTQAGAQPTLRYYLGPSTLSGLFDFPVMWRLRDALADRAPMTELAAEVERSRTAWLGSGAVMAMILGNHDVPRFISDVNGDAVWQPRDSQPASPTADESYDLLKLAWAFLLTQPGAPVIYYGDEIGLPGANDPDNRRDMRFGDALSERESGVLRQVQTLGRARACSAALRRGDVQTLVANDNLYVYARPTADGFPAIVVINRAAVARELALVLPTELAVSSDAHFVDWLGAAVSRAGDTLTLEVPARGAALLVSDAACVQESAP